LVGTAETLFGAEAVNRFKDRKIAEALKAEDAADWLFIQGVVTTASYHLVRESRMFFQRLTPYRSEFEQLLREVRDDPDFKDIRVDDLFGDSD